MFSKIKGVRRPSSPNPQSGLPDGAAKNKASKENLTQLNKFVFNKNFICCRESRIEGPSSFYSSFYIGPFDESFSLTLAHNLRRTLLSELTGLAILAVEIDGVLHRFSSLSGVKETTIDILSNLQNIVLKKTSISSDGSMAAYQQTAKYGLFNSSNFTNIMTNQIGYLRTRGPGVVTAADIILPSGIECVNPDKHIATLAEDGILNMRLIITEGKNSIKQKSGSSNSKYAWGLGANPADQSSEPLLDMSEGSGVPPADLEQSNTVSSLTNTKLEDASTAASSMEQLNSDLGNASTLLEPHGSTLGLPQDGATPHLNLKNSKPFNSNLIFLDSVFMPVTKVNSFVETNPKATDMVLENSAEYRNLDSKTILDVLETFLGPPGAQRVGGPSKAGSSVNGESDTSMVLSNFDPAKVQDGPTAHLKSESMENTKGYNPQSGLGQLGSNLETTRRKSVGEKAFFTLANTKSQGSEYNQPNVEKNFFEVVPSNLGHSLDGAFKSETLMAREAGLIPNLNNSINLTYKPESNILANLPKTQCHIVLEIWTNGSIHPRQALDSALDFLTTTLLTLKNVKQLGSMYKSDLTYKKLLKEST